MKGNAALGPGRRDKVLAGLEVAQYQAVCIVSIREKQKDVEAGLLCSKGHGLKGFVTGMHAARKMGGTGGGAQLEQSLLLRRVYSDTGGRNCARFVSCRNCR